MNKQNLPHKIDKKKRQRCCSSICTGKIQNDCFTVIMSESSWYCAEFVYDFLQNNRFCWPYGNLYCSKAKAKSSQQQRATTAQLCNSCENEHPTWNSQQWPETYVFYSPFLFCTEPILSLPRSQVC